MWVQHSRGQAYMQEKWESCRDHNPVGAIGRRITNDTVVEIYNEYVDFYRNQGNEARKNARNLARERIEREHADYTKALELIEGGLVENVDLYFRDANLEQVTGRSELGYVENAANGKPRLSVIVSKQGIAKEAVLDQLLFQMCY